MAQRLVRTLCKNCKEEFTPTDKDLPVDFPRDELNKVGGKLFRAKGCRACHNIGYSGRVAILELLVTTEDIRKLAHDRASSWEIRRAGVKNGMRTLRQDGWNKVLAGRTTIEEIARTTKGDRIEH